jgi:hypothetical protein
MRAAFHNCHRYLILLLLTIVCATTAVVSVMQVRGLRDPRRLGPTYRQRVVNFANHNATVRHNGANASGAHMGPVCARRTGTRAVCGSIDQDHARRRRALRRVARLLRLGVRAGRLRRIVRVLEVYGVAAGLILCSRNVTLRLCVG